MGKKDSTITSKLQQTSQKIIHQDLQNGLLDIMAKQVLPKNLERIRERHFYSIICDERTDCSNREQLSFNIGTVDENLDTHEDYLGFYEVHNIKSSTTVIAIRLRFNL